MHCIRPYDQPSRTLLTIKRTIKAVSCITNVKRAYIKWDKAYKLVKFSLTSPKTPKYTKCFMPLIAKNFEPYIDAQKPASELILQTKCEFGLSKNY